MPNAAQRREQVEAAETGARNVIVVKKGQTWRCSNKECGAEILVMHESKTKNEEVLRCWCRSEMRKPYERPQIGIARGQ
jgi:hypothetical protein